MKTSFLIVLCILCIMSSVNSFAQNEKLEVDGVISTTDGGVEFPDQTLQTTAYIPPNPPTAPGGLANQPFIFIEGESDTVHIIQISSLGGVREVSHTTGGPLFHSTDALYLEFTKQVDAWTPEFFRFLTSTGNPLIFTIHYVNENNEVYHKVRLEGVRLLSQIHRSEYTGYGYMNLEVVTAFFERMENETLIPMPPRISWCWNFETGQSCN